MHLIEMSKADADNGGFGIRDKLGNAVQRGFMVEARHRDEAYYGTTLVNLRQTLADDHYKTAGKPEFAQALDAFMNRLAAEPKVASWFANAPDEPRKRQRDFTSGLLPGSEQRNRASLLESAAFT